MGKTETWTDLLKQTREDHGPLVAYLSDDELYLVMKEVLDYIITGDIQEKNQHALIKRFVRQSDKFIKILFSKEVYSSKGVPKNLEIDVFFKDYTQPRIEKYRKLLRDGQKVDIDNLLNAARHMIFSHGPYIALHFLADHIDLVDTKTISGELQLTDRDWLNLAFKITDNMHDWARSSTVIRIQKYYRDEKGRFCKPQAANQVKFGYQPASIISIAGKYNQNTKNYKAV